MRGSGKSKHCATNVADDEEAVLAAIVAANFILNKDEEQSTETVMDLPNVLAVLFTKERSHIPRITGYAVRHRIPRFSLYLRRPK